MFRRRNPIFLFVLVVLVLLARSQQGGAQNDMAATTENLGKKVEETRSSAEIVTLLQELRKQRAGLAAEATGAQGDNLLVVQAQIDDLDAEIWENMTAGTAQLSALEESSRAEIAAELRGVVREHLRLARREQRLLDIRIRRNQTLRPRKKAEELLDVVDALSRDQKRLSQSLERILEGNTLLGVLGKKADKELKALDADLAERRDNLLSGLGVLDEQQKEVTERPRETEEEKAAAKQEMKVLNILIANNENGLQAIVALMKKRELDVTEVEQLLLERSGEVNLDVLDRDVALGLLQSWWKKGVDFVVDSGPQLLFKILVFLLILVVGRFLAAVVRWIARRLVKRPAFSLLLQDFIVWFVGKFVMLIALVVALTQLGASPGPILAGLGVAGFILGFALQETLSNFASGLMILAYRPFDVGDVVEGGGVVGKVHKMTLVSTTIKTFDNQRLIVPNNKIWGDVIKNVNAEATRRVDLVFGIGYSDDIDKAQKILTDIVAEHDLILDEPAPVVRIGNLADSAVEFVVRPWAKSDDYWQVYWDTTEAVKRRFDAEGVSIPFPQQDVHMHQVP